MAIYLSAVVFAYVFISHVKSFTMNGTDECELVKSIVRPAHIGWPTTIACDNLYAAYRVQPTRNSEIATCFIIDGITNATIWSQDLDLESGFIFHLPDYTTPDLYQNSTKLYHIILKTNSTCFYDVMKINLTKNEDLTCEQAKERIASFRIEGHRDSLKKLKCKVKYLYHPKISLDVGTHDYTVTWYRNCSVLKPNPSIYRIDDRELVIYSMDFNISGIYSCSIDYKGRRRFVVQFAVCVKPHVHYADPIVNCPEVISASKRELTSLTCNVDAGFAVFNRLLSSVTWQQDGRNSSYKCWNSVGLRTGTGWNGRAKCYSNFTEAQDHNQRCYLYEPTEDEKSSMRNVLNTTLLIGNTQISDFGNYVVIFRRLGEKTNDTIQVVRDQSHLQTSYMYIIVSLSVIVGLLLIGILVAIIVKCVKKNRRYT